MARRYFGTDGVRGRVGSFPIVPDFVVRLGHAAGLVLARHSKDAHPTVLIGKDTRISGYMLEACLQAGFSSAGVDIVLCGPIPTPAVAYLTQALRLTAGVVISASHNPYTDNGIKFFSSEGLKLPDEIEQEIESELDRGMQSIDSDQLGKAVRLDDAQGRYIEFCKSTISGKVHFKGMKLYLDTANGAAYKVAPAVFHELGAIVTVENNHPNGLNINLNCGATHTETLSDRVRKAGCDVGLSFDGDADRLIMADAEGRVYNGDQLLYIIVCDRLRKHPVKGVAGTLMSNYGLEKRLRELSIPFERTKVGDRYVVEKLLEKGWLYGGESSGHVLCLDRQTTGDGIVTAMQVLSAMRRTGQSLAELTADLHMLPQVLINCRLEPGFDWMQQKPLLEAKAKVDSLLEGRGRVLIRPSGTEPVLRIMVEAPEEAEARRLAEEIASTLRQRKN
ncbi:phosphoglucosamine mutase [Mesosutterella sp. OilRF-GAM-744-9]|uniref:Phosphoglucosamine mutase n=1 Tax=Mesosutterella porci TaxID=2915351 RepID=A0ABS9MUA2_9BURK|nr:phosphoglucosamine mutase [Mesosutterella sp. oilRF-744-WT-GAM-9]MCG5031598.1 phosphoglucosamine mutase [Mesosutterella sp. oilRF-744-WT-GAM-9]